MVTKTSVEKVIVVRPDTAVPASGDRLFDGTTNVPNLEIGAFGAYADVAGSQNPVAIDSGDYTGQPFRFVQRRDPNNITMPLTLS